MKPFEANFDTIVWRFYLMMAVVIVPFFLGIPLFSLLALPMFLIAILGISFKKETNIEKSINAAKERRLIVPTAGRIMNEAS